jgi:thioredoxin reductase
VTEHGGSIVNACVTGVDRLSADHFRVSAETENGKRTFNARRLLLATGLRDLTPDCPGFRDFYGASVHHCPDCDGYECRDKRVAVIGNGLETVGFTLGLLTWTNKLTLITGGAGHEIGPVDRKRLAAFDIQVRDQSITALEGDKGSKQLKRILFSNNDSMECEALFFNLGSEPASDLHEKVGCKLDPASGLIWVDPTQQTSVKGVFAAGDITPKSQLAIVAAAEGAMAAVHIHESLIPADRKL